MSVHLYIWDFVSTLWVKYTEIQFNQEMNNDLSIL